MCYCLNSKQFKFLSLIEFLHFCVMCLLTSRIACLWFFFLSQVCFFIDARFVFWCLDIIFLFVLFVLLTTLLLQLIQWLPAQPPYILAIKSVALKTFKIATNCKSIVTFEYRITWHWIHSTGGITKHIG